MLSPLSRPLSSPELFQKVLQDLKSVIEDSDRISTSKKFLLTHTAYRVTSAEDLADILVYPISTREVGGIAKIATKYQVPIIPYGGGTSLEGGLLATYGGICIDFKHMAQVLEIRPDDMDVTVQPGLVWTELNQQLATHSLFFPPDPGFGATIGGMISTSCSGTNAARYGTIKDGWVLGMVAVLADGTIVRTKGRAKKSSAGYDLNRLLVGAEGTLAIITEATLRLTSVPKFTAVATSAFDNVEDVIHVASEVLRHGIGFQCLELVDEVFMAVFEQSRGQAGQDQQTAGFSHKPHLFAKLTANTDAILAVELQSLEDICCKNGSDFRLAKDEVEKEVLWAARKRCGTALRMAGLQTGGCMTPTAISTDVCVPLSELSKLLRAHRHDLDSKGLRAGLLGHIVLYDRAEEGQTKAATDAHQRLVEMALEAGGTCTGEHGIGRYKTRFLEDEYGECLVQLMRGIKNVFDPLGILNPGVIFAESQELPSPV